MLPEEELARRIQSYVATQVPPEQVALVSRAVGMCLTTLMADPRFLNELQVFKDLQARIAWLHNENIMLKQMATGSPRRPAKKKAAPRRPPPTKMAGNASAAAKQAFQQGYSSP